MSTIETAPSDVAKPVGVNGHKHEIDRLFEALVKLSGSDLHLKADQPPIIRVKGTLQPLKHPKIDDARMRQLCMPIMSERQRKIFEEEGGVDFAHTCVVDGVRWRFRVNLLTQQGAMGMVARRVNNTIPDFKGLFLPDSIERLCVLDQGMVLLAGVTGSGKSTTIGSMLNYINRTYRKHILTLEDPIEFVF
ncbi:MAG: type IV pilus twitching motility protein PilT, partial [Pirellulales bacterium]